MSKEAGRIQIGDPEQLFGAEQRGQLEALLTDWLQQQRWYRSKAKMIAAVRVDGGVRATLPGAFFYVIRVEFEGGDCERYLLPLVLAEPSGEIPASEVVANTRDRSGVERRLVNGLTDQAFRNFLLDSIACDSVFEGPGGQFVMRRTNALDWQCGQAEPELPSKVLRAEQSNSSIVFGNRYILKVFRKLEEGLNPDIEIGRFLTEGQFAYSPPVLGTIEYVPAGGEPMFAGILQGFVANQGDAWRYTLDSLTGFFDRALTQGAPPALPNLHPFSLMNSAVTPVAVQSIGEYLQSARLLGTRTAQMHSALAGGDTHPDFAPQPFAPEWSKRLYSEMLEEADRAFDLLRRKRTNLMPEAAESAERLLAEEAAVRRRFEALTSHSVNATLIRHHGDYHLGQVLYTGSDFVIIDFEGEPARPLPQRRQRALAMRDVAGMVRSFSYAGFAAMFGQVPGISVTDNNRQQIESWAAYWGAWVSAQYLHAYFEEADGKAFVSKSDEERKMLFDAFSLQKALYEVNYELNNRPDWVQIPLRGILTLIA